MKRAIIFANGIMNTWPVGFEISGSQDWVMAADGGVAHCLQWNITPQVIIGDMDSVNKQELARFESQGVEIIRFPARKDKTDLELALQTALNRNFGEVVILGALGARWDMTLSNVMILAAPFMKGVKARILDEGHEILCMHDGDAIQIQEKLGDTVSLIPLSTNVVVSLNGFEYPLTKETLHRGTTRGISNVITGSVANIEIERGQLIVVISISY